MKVTTFLLIAVLSTFSSLSYAAKGSSTETKPSKGKGGWGESYGGNIEISEFKSRGLEVFYYSLKDGAFHLSIDFSSTREAIRDLHVVCKKDLYLDGVKKDAINYPNEVPQRLELDCSKWMTLNTQQKRILAVHEFLPLFGIEDKDYALSSALIIHYKERRDLDDDKSRILFQAAVTCDNEKFDSLMADEETNIYYVNADNNTILDAAIKSNCSYQVKEIINTGYFYDYSRFPFLTERPEFILIENVLSDVLTLNPKYAAWSITDMNNILDRIIPLKTADDYFSSLNSFLDAQGECNQHNDLLLMILKKYERRLDSDENHQEAIKIFFSGLVKRGFPIDNEDACNNSAKKILRKYNLL